MRHVLAAGVFVLLASVHSVWGACVPLTNLTFCAALNGLSAISVTAAQPGLLDTRAIALTKSLSKGSTTYLTCGFSTSQCCRNLTTIACSAAAKMLYEESGLASTEYACTAENSTVTHASCLSST